MQLTDDGQVLVMTSKPWLIGKIFAVVFALFAVLMPVAIVTSLVRPEPRATLTCDRGAGTCSFGSLAPVAIAEVAGAKVLYVPGASNRSAGHRVQVTTRSGEVLEVSQPSFHDDVTAEMRLATDGLNAFLADPGRSSFTAGFVAEDTDWSALVPLTVMSIVAAILFLRNWVTRRVELDRAGKRLRLQIDRKVGGSTDESFGFSEVSRLTLSGYNWGRLVAATSRGQRILVVVPRSEPYRARLVELAEKLTQAMGTELQAGDGFRRTWKMKR